jgi:hypothetical protein
VIARISLFLLAGIVMLGGLAPARPCSPSKRLQGRPPPRDLPATAPLPPPPPRSDPMPPGADGRGKYTNLLLAIRAPEDAKTYGDYKDFGKWSGSAYRSVLHIPPGYWVYVRPIWYVWGEQIAPGTPPTLEQRVKALEAEVKVLREELRKRRSGQE